MADVTPPTPAPGLHPAVALRVELTQDGAQVELHVEAGAEHIDHQPLLELLRELVDKLAPRVTVKGPDDTAPQHLV